MTEFVFKRYVCDICSSQYDTMEKAKECEANHIQIENCRIADADYSPGSSYPAKLYIKAPNRVEMVYSLESVKQSNGIVWHHGT